MNLVFKYLAIIVLFTAFTIHAEEQDKCATLFIQQSDDFILDIAKVDSKPVDFTRNYRKVMSGRTEYKILPGEHVLTFLQYPKGYYQFRRSHFAPRASAKGLIDIKMKVIHLMVEADHTLHIGLAENSDSASLTLVNQKKESCQSHDDSVAIGFDNTLYVDKEPLPKTLEQNLLSIMDKIHKHHQQTMTTETNVLPIRQDEYFGAVIDNSYTESNHIKILSILPLSLAAKFGLKSGDVITHLGNKQIDSTVGEARDVFAEYLRDVKYHDYLIFDVIRNNETMNIQGRKRLAIIPGSHYYFETAPIQPLKITNTKKMDPKITFEYQRQMLAIHDYYQSKGIEADKVRLFREASISNYFGIRGKEIAGMGLLIVSINDDSPMKSFNLKEGDMILSVGHHKGLVDNVKLLLAEMATWQDDQDLFLTVNREGQQLTLSGKYQPDVLPAFSLALDMNAEKYIKEDLSRRNFWYRFPHRNNSSHYGVSSTMNKQPNESHINSNRK